MNNRRAIFWLLLVTAGAVIANLFFTWKEPETSTLQNLALIDSLQDVTSLTISRPGEASVVLSKGTHWRLTSPYTANVDEEVVLKLIDALSFASIDDMLTEAELQKLGRSREDFGLLEPRLIITVASREGATEISFGDTTPTGTDVYGIRGGGSAILAIPLEVFEGVNLKTDELRNRSLFVQMPESIVGLDLKRSGESPISFTLEDGTWKVGTGVASITKTNELLAQILDAKAKTFVWPIGATNETEEVSAAVLSGYGLDSESALSVNLRCRDGIDRRILIGRDVGSSEAYALVHGGQAVVTIDSSLKVAAAQNLQAFLDQRLFPIEASAVNAFSLTDGDMSYVLARTDSGSWRLDSPLSATADSDAVTTLLGRILALTPADLTSQGVKVSVSTNYPTVSVYAQSVISGRLEDLRSREILKLDSALVKRIVSMPGDKQARTSVSVVYNRERRMWSEEAKNAPARAVNETHVAAIFAELGSLKAERIVALKASAADMSRYGLEEPYYTVSIDQERADAVRRNILIGDETEGGRFATIGSAESIFVLSQKTVSVLTADLVED